MKTQTLPKDKQQKDQDLQEKLPDFKYRNHQILIKTVEYLVRLDTQNLLADINYIDRIQITKTKHDIKKLVYINFKNFEEFYEKCSIRKEVIRKETKQVFYKYNHKMSKKHNYIAMFSQKVYNFLDRKLKDDNFNLNIIVCNVYNNYYLYFDQFLKDIVDLVNARLMKIYINEFFDFVVQNQTLQAKIYFWENLAFTITRIWRKFNMYLYQNKIHSKHDKSLEQAYRQLFSSNIRFKCQQTSQMEEIKQIAPCLTLTKQFQKQQQQIRKIMKTQNLQISYYLDKDLFLQQLIQVNQSIKPFPFIQNYPFIQDYTSEKCKDQQQVRRSFKRPDPTCFKQCSCVQKSSRYHCDNRERKVECQHHQCQNSQIRTNKEMLCWYLQQDKNKHHKLQHILKRHENKYQLMETHSYGMDSYTARILFQLMPYFHIQFGQNIQNDDIKENIIQNLIPYKTIKTKSLYQSVVQLCSQSFSNKLPNRYQLQVLEKKLRYIQNLHIFDQYSIYKKLRQPFKTLNSLNCQYKGLGIVNYGVEIEMGKFIGKFIGEVLQPWREQERQIVSSRVAKHGYKNQQKGQIKFYCISVIKHLDQPNALSCFSIDPQNMGNFTRSLNHSCDPNCKAQIMVSQGKYVLAIYAIRPIKPLQELTFDYMSITDNLEEYKKAICFCGSLNCKGRYFKYQQEVQYTLDRQFLSKEYPIQMRMNDLRDCCFGEFNLTISQMKEIITNNHVNLPCQLAEHQWVVRWVYKAYLMFLKEIQCWKRKNFKKQYQIFSKLHQKSIKQNNFYQLLFKERIQILNNKISKIYRLMNTINCFQPPLKLGSRQNIILMLENSIRKNQGFTQFIKLQNTSSSQKSLILRQQLLDLSRQNFMKMRKNECIQCLKKSYKFLTIRPTIYPTYISDPVQIWRQNEISIQQTVQYKGKNFFILQNLICWGQQLLQNETIPINQKTVNIKNFHTLDRQILQQKRDLLRKYVANCEMNEENILKLTKPKEVKQFQFMKMSSFNHLSKQLKQWTKAQTIFYDQSNSKQQQVVVKYQDKITKGYKNTLNIKNRQ